MPRFHYSEIFHFARAIEDAGERFYRLAAERVGDPEVRRLFLRLAAEEVGHGRLFAELQRRFGEQALDGDFPEEHLAYLRAYVDTLIFDEAAIDQSVSSLGSALEAVRFAKGREKDAIHFYLEMRALLPEEDATKIDDLIEEERRHFRELAEHERQLVEPSEG